MKKSILVVLIVLTTTITFGQTSLGVKAGVNLSTTSGFFSNPKSLLAEHAGFYTNLNFGKHFFLRPELLYTVKGYKFPAWETYDKGSLLCSYIAAPILIGIRSTENISVLLGAEVGYLIGANYRFADSAATRLRNFNKVDGALDLGAVYSIGDRISAEVRYSHGFKDLVDANYADQSGNHTRKVGAHRVFQLSLNYQLAK